jgi:hypothetical protein
MKVSFFYDDLINETKAIKGETLDVLVPKLGELLYDLLSDSPVQILGMPEFNNFKSYYSEWFRNWEKGERDFTALLEFVRDYLERYINHNLSDNKTTKLIRQMKEKFPGLDLKIKRLFNPDYTPREEKRKFKEIEKSEKEQQKDELRKLKDIERMKKIELRDLEREEKLRQKEIERAEKQKIRAIKNREGLDKKEEERQIRKVENIVNTYTSERDAALANLKNILDDMKSKTSEIGGEQELEKAKNIERYFKHLSKEYRRMQKIMDDYETEKNRALLNLKRHFEGL